MRRKRRFVHAIRTGKPLEPDLVRGAEIQACLDACQRSAAALKPESPRAWQ